MLIVKSFTFNPVQENTYFVYNEERQLCIIDPGTYFPAEREELLKAVKDLQLEPVLLVNTHCHLDHVFGNKFVYETWQLELHLHKQEEQMLALAPLSGEKWGLPFESYQGPLHFIEDGTAISIGNDKLHVLFTPGHSPGSVSFYSPKDQFVIAGDVLFDGSVGRTDLPMGDFDTLMESIKTQLYTLPDATKVHPGHGGPTTIGAEKKSNPFVKG